jgi:hypothetical protein
MYCLKKIGRVSLLLIVKWNSGCRWWWEHKCFEFGHSALQHFTFCESPVWCAVLFLNAPTPLWKFTSASRMTTALITPSNRCQIGKNEKKRCPPLGWQLPAKTTAARSLNDIPQGLWTTPRAQLPGIETQHANSHQPSLLLKKSMSRLEMLTPTAQIEGTEKWLLNGTVEKTFSRVTAAAIALPGACKARLCTCTNSQISKNCT